MSETLEQFRENLISEIQFDAQQDGVAPRDEFIKQIIQILIDAEEFMEFTPLQFESVGSRNAKIQIDGYNFDDLENCLEFFICDFNGGEEVQTLNNTEAKSLFKKMVNFVTNSMNGFIIANGEPSAPGYGLAEDMENRYKDVKKYKFYIISDRLMSSRIDKFENNEVARKEATYNIWDIGRLFALDQSKNGREDVIIHLEDFNTKGIPCLKAGKSDEYTAFLCNIPGKVLADLYNKYGGRLLEGNVRSFLTAKGKINKQIRNTILNDPQKFFAYNNGIAATASDVKTKMGSDGLLLTEIDDLQIVNGGQTTASLAAALINDRDRANDLKDIYVPMKLSVVSHDIASTLIPEIARFANSQNKVSEADFFSNSPFHIRMEQCSRQLLAPAVDGNQYGTYWYYERARGSFRQEQAKLTTAEKKKFLKFNPKNQVITKTDLAKYYDIYRMLPDEVSKGAQKNFMKFAEWAADAWEKDPNQFNKEFYKLIIDLDILFKTVDTIVRKSSWYDGGYKAQVNTYALSWLFYLITKDCAGKAIDFKNIWSKQKASDETERQLESIARKTYDYLTDEHRGVQNVTEWAKRPECWKRLKAVPFTLNPSFVDELIDGEVVKENAHAAKKEQKEINKVTAMIDVEKYGVTNWKKLLVWCSTNSILSMKEKSILTQCISLREKGKFPSEAQSVCLLKILEKARLESYPD